MEVVYALLLMFEPLRDRIFCHPPLRNEYPMVMFLDSVMSCFL